MSYKNNENDYSTRYSKCAGFGFCACCNESVCITNNELNNSIETFDCIINEKIKTIRSREDKNTYTKDEVIQILKS
ncbi:alpha-1,2-mannosidase [Clostridium saccharoperbutylacetonicum]